MTFASRDRADRALLPFGLAKIFGNNAGVPSVTGLAGPAGDRAAVRKVQPARAARALQLAPWTAPIACSCHPASRRYSATMRAFLQVSGLPVAARNVWRRG
jgi:hypothetical protein